MAGCPDKDNVLNGHLHKHVSQAVTPPGRYACALKAFIAAIRNGHLHKHPIVPSTAVKDFKNILEIFQMKDFENISSCSRTFREKKWRRVQIRCCIVSNFLNSK